MSKTWLKHTSIILWACSLLLPTRPAFAYLQYGSDTRCLYIDQPVKADEWNRFQLIHIEAISALEGADEKLFDDARTFPNLKTVFLVFDEDWCTRRSYSYSERVGKAIDVSSFSQTAHRIRSAATLDRYLLMLGLNYPKLRSLSIHRTKPISDAELSCLAKFTRLQKLSLSGPIAHPANLQRMLPAGLLELELLRTNYTSDSEILPKFPNLRKLVLSACSLGSSFLTKLDATKLQKLSLIDVESQPDSFSNLARFSSLSEIVLTRTVIDESILSGIKRSIRISIDDGETYRPINH